jgi:hypothetical protein
MISLWAILVFPTELPPEKRRGKPGKAALYPKGLETERKKALFVANPLSAPL